MVYIGEQKREYQRQWIARRREDYFLEKWCIECGSIDSLELDHINREEKIFNPSTLWGMSDNNPKKIAELEKCQVLCYYCHKKKTYYELAILEHGTRIMYQKRRCRCDLCKEAQAEHQRNWRRNARMS